MQSVLDAGFKKYGRVIADIDTSEIVKLMDSYDMPEDVVYVAGDKKLETGKQIPSLTTFVKICEQLDTTPDFLLLGSLHTDNLPKNIYDSLALCNKKDLPLIQDIVENFVSKRE